MFLPREELTSGDFHALKKLMAAKSKGKVQIAVTAVDIEKQIINGKYVPEAGKGKPDVAELLTEEAAGVALNGTIVAVQEYGLTVELVDYGVQGLVPIEKVPDAANKLEKYP